MSIDNLTRIIIDQLTGFFSLFVLSSEPSFAFEPQSIWHGNLRHIHFKAEPLLCADENWNFKNAQLTCRSLGI